MVDLPFRFPAGSAVDLGHEEDLVAVAVAQRLPHADLAVAVVIIPAVVHEGDAVIDGGANDLDRFVHAFGVADVVAAHADRRHFHTSAAERPVAHVAAHALVERLQRQAFGGVIGGGSLCRTEQRSDRHGQTGGGADHLHKIAALHGKLLRRA